MNQAIPFNDSVDPVHKTSLNDLFKKSH